MQQNPLGIIVGGSLTHGFTVRINAHVAMNELKTGKFVTIISKPYKFFALVTDLTLQATHPDITLFPPTTQQTLLINALKQHHVYATAHIKPLLLCDEHNRIAPVKTIPSHFCPVFDTDAQDIALIFGDEHEHSKRYFAIGKPLDMQTPVCINLERLTERSTGIFGKTGTGKTFLTRLVLAGLIKNNKAINLIFDMHSEYGVQARQETGAAFVKGLKQLFSNNIALFSLDPVSTRRRGVSPDVTINIAYDEITVEDILSLQHELNLHTTALEAAYLIATKYKKQWLSTLLAQEDLKTFATEIGAHPESIAALYRKLKRLERLPFLTTNRQTGASIIDRLIEYLDRGIHVIIEFGNFTQSFCYLLVANIITRRIHELYVNKTERFLASQNKSDEPRKLVITIEEAHKFLNPIAASQTIFGTIAREMRKYYVSLLVVDQRPSGIDDEIISQLGTKIIAQLSDEKDINSALSGVANAQDLRGILAALDTKQQALILGHAVAMPIVIQTRAYDELFYSQIQQETLTTSARDHVIQEIFS